MILRSNINAMSLSVLTIAILGSFGCGIKGRPLPPIQQPIFEQQSAPAQTQPQPAKKKASQKPQPSESSGTNPKEQK